MSSDEDEADSIEPDDRVQRSGSPTQEGPRDPTAPGDQPAGSLKERLRERLRVILASYPVRTIMLVLAWCLSFLVMGMLYRMLDVLGLIWTPENFQIEDTILFIYEQPQQLVCYLLATTLVLALPWMRKERGERSMHPVLTAVALSCLPMLGYLYEWLEGAGHQFMGSLSLLVGLLVTFLALSGLQLPTPRKRTRELTLFATLGFSVLALFLSNEDATFPEQAPLEERDAWGRERFPEVYPSVVQFLHDHPGLEPIAGPPPYSITLHPTKKSKVWRKDDGDSFHLSFLVRSKKTKGPHKRCVARGSLRDGAIARSVARQVYCLDEDNERIFLKPPDIKEARAADARRE